MTSRKLLQSIALASMMTWATIGNTEDIDLFNSNPNIASQRPNVLIFVDNTANWNQAFTNEVSALVSTVNGLTDQFNVGVMLLVETGNPNDSVDGSYVRAAVRQMTTANKNALSNLVSHIDITEDKGNNATYGLAMAEAYRYFGGITSVSGFGKAKRDYAGNTYGTSYSQAVYALSGNAYTSAASSTYVSPISDACQKNFIIVISNGPAGDNSSSTSTATTALTDAGGSTTTISLTPNGEESNISDEWAQFLSTHDINSAQSGTQTVSTYTVDVDPVTTGQGPSHTALLKSMANKGKGKYFSVSSSTSSASIADALNKIFTEIQAVNSVFASSTLPVSVNVRGTYLNQVYMGIFRPDGNSSPRWPGNLKQYQLGVIDGTNNLQLVDRTPLPVENASTGFITPTAKSFWTATSTFWDASYYPDAQGSGGTSDLPDGDIVEKGGAAQRLRSIYATSQTARNLYTCNGTCTSNSLLSGTPFATSNTNITATSLGLTPVKSITSLTRNGTTATATVNNHGLSNGTSVLVSGANETQYNGQYPISILDANRFTYIIAVEPSSYNPATGTLSLPATISYTITSLSRNSSGLVTVNAPGNTYVNGDTISISGISPSGYNGSYAISCGASCNPAFTYSITLGPTTPGGGGTAQVGTATVNIATSAAKPNGIARTNLSVTVNTTSKHGFANSGTVIIASATPSDYNGSWSYTKTSNTAFTFNLPDYTPSSTGIVVTGATASKAGNATANISTLTRTDGTGATATARATTASNLTGAPWNLVVNSNQSVTISGANNSAYNGTFTSKIVDANTIDYSITTAPATPATGTMTEGSTATAADVINWQRGQNDRTQDNPNGLSTAVRGYLHGDVLHSRPAVVNYNRNGDNRDIVIYYGANDGILHATKGGQDDADGYEKWGFIPTEQFSKLSRLYLDTPAISTSDPKPYFTDGPISTYIKDANSDGKLVSTDGDLVHIYTGMRRGGRYIYALNVSDPDTPKLLWKKSNTDSGFSELGQTWSELKTTKIKGHANPVVIFGAGYDNVADDTLPAGTNTMGRGVFVVDALDGSLVWQASSSYGITHSIPADVTIIDRNGDGYTDRIYAADTGGNIWRMDINDANSANWSVNKIAALGGSGSNERKFLYAPDVVFGTTYDSLLIGSGDREKPFDTTITNQFYMIKDTGTGLANVVTPAITQSSLYDATGNLIQTGTADQKSAATSALNSAKGWYITFGTGEKTVSGSTTLGGTVFFGTNIPESQLSAPGTCSAGLGEARLYALSYLDASSTIDFNATGTLTTSDRYQKREGGGYPPTPVPVAVQIDGKTYEGAITGTQVLSPPSSVLEKRYRVYWNLELD